MSTSALRARVEMSRGGNFLFRYGTFNHTFPSTGKEERRLKVTIPISSRKVAPGKIDL